MKVGEIQGITVFFVPLEGRMSPKEEVWFSGGNHSRWTDLETLKRIGFKISRFLTKAGFVIKNPDGFDKFLKNMLRSETNGVSRR